MRPIAITTSADTARIEAGPYHGFMPHRHVLSALQAAAARHGPRPALRYLHGPQADDPQRAWTHAELLADIHRAAHLFRALTGAEVPRVALLMPAIAQAHIALWGAEAVGVACPINHLLQADHLAQLLQATGANIVVALGPDPSLDIGPRVQALRAQCPALRHVLLVDPMGQGRGPDDFDTLLKQQPAHAPDLGPADDGHRLAALFHTGGTTGAPKLAQHTHANQLHAAWGAACHYAMDEHDVMLTAFPLFHVAGAFVFGLSTLLAGGEVLLPTLHGLRNPALLAAYWAVAERQCVTLLAAVPTVMAMLMGVPRGDADLRRVRALLTGGSPLPRELATAFEQQTGIPVRNILGMTECAGVIAIEPFRAPRVPGSCGLPLPFTRVVAVGAGGQPLPPGQTGVLHISGPHVGPGYTEAARNAGTFDAEGALLSGDLGHVDAEGRVFVTGRAKDVIIRSSHNIDPESIEEALLRHPQVQMAAAVGEPDEHAGERPVAFVVLKPGATVDGAAVLADTLPHLAERPAWPRWVQVLPALPLTAIGKVYKPALRRLATEQVLQNRALATGQALTVQVVEGPSGLQARFAVAEADVAAQAAVRALMQPFAIDWVFDLG